MEKNKFCDELRKRGYDASVDGGVVMVKKAGKLESILKEVKELAAKLEYNQSIGVKLLAKETEKKAEKTSEEIVDYLDDEDDEALDEKVNENTFLEGKASSNNPDDGDFTQMSFLDML